MRTAVSTDGAPKAIGPYSQAIRAGSLLFLSGQIPIDPATGQMADGDIAQQAQTLALLVDDDRPIFLLLEIEPADGRFLEGADRRRVTAVTDNDALM